MMPTRAHLLRDTPLSVGRRSSTSFRGATEQASRRQHVLGAFSCCWPILRRIPALAPPACLIAATGARFVVSEGIERTGENVTGLNADLDHEIELERQGPVCLQAVAGPRNQQRLAVSGRRNR
jgi:hypothetical protein